MELISLVKSKKESGAISLIQNGTDTACIDADKNSALHYASAAGLVNVIVSILEDSVLTLDLSGKDGKTAVHYAVLNRNVDAFVALVTYGANINILDEKGRSALDLALINKDQGLVKLLCYFGTEVLVQDWIVFTIDLESLDKKERPSIKLVHEQNDRLAAMEFGSIMYKLKHIKAQDLIQYYLRLGVSLNTTSIDSDYFLYIAKESTEYANVQFMLEANESILSDVFEVIAWGSKPDTITFEIKVEGRPRCNERILMLPIEGEAKIDIISQLDENTNEENIETTNISVKVNLKTITKFAIKVKEVPEIFSVSYGSACFKPEMEPNATIDIPEGAFPSGGKLQVNISETKDWNDESIEDEIPVLFTNAMDLTMLNDSQPNQPVTLKIPIHSSIPSDDDVVILASERESPEESDWEVRRIHQRDRNFVSFDASHFSVYIATSKRNLEKSIQLATKVLKRERRVEFFVMVKNKLNGKLSMVVECVQKKYGKRRRKYWQRKRFIKQSIEFKDCIMRSKQSFRMKFTGNIETDSLAEQDHIITFNPTKKKKKGNYRTFHLTNDTKNIIQGEVQIELHVIIQQITQTTNSNQLVSDTPSLGTICCQKSIEPLEAGTQTSYVPGFEFELALPVDTQVPEFLLAVVVDPRDPECTIPVLRRESLRRIVSNFSEEECFYLGRHLNIPTKTIQKLRDEETIRDRLLQIWRPNRPNERLVHNLVDALKAIEKEEEANNVEEAFSSSMEYLE